MTPIPALGHMIKTFLNRSPTNSSTASTASHQSRTQDPRESVNHGLRPLPPGWIRDYSPRHQHEFFVDTRSVPPRSIWCHPLDDEEYLASFGESASGGAAASRGSVVAVRGGDKGRKRLVPGTILTWGEFSKSRPECKGADERHRMLMEWIGMWAPRRRGGGAAVEGGRVDLAI